MKMRMAFNLLKITPFRFCQYLRKVLRYISINENLERVLKCLWIYLHTGIKNDIADNTKPLLQKLPSENNKLNPLKRQVTMQKKQSQIGQDKQIGQQVVISQVQIKKQSNVSQERKTVQVQMPIKTVSQLLGGVSSPSENEIKLISESTNSTKIHSLKKRPMSQRQERQISIFQDGLLEEKKYYNIEPDQNYQQNDDNDNDQSDGGYEDNQMFDDKALNTSILQKKLVKKMNTSINNIQSHPHQVYYSEQTNITQDYTPSSNKFSREKVKRLASNIQIAQKLDESFSQSFNANQLQEKMEDLQPGKYAKQIEYSMPSLSIQEQYMLTSALPKRPTSKRLNHSYIRKNTMQPLQQLQSSQNQSNTSKPLGDLSNNQYDQSNLTSSNQNILSNPNPTLHHAHSLANQENKEAATKYTAVKVSESKPYISEFDDRFAKLKEFQVGQLNIRGVEDISLKPKKISVQQQQQQNIQQQQAIVKQTRIIIDTLSKNKQRSESQKPQTVNTKSSNNNASRSKSRNTSRTIPKKKVN